MGYVFAVLVQVISGLIGVVAGLVAILLAGAGAMVGLSFAAVFIAFVLLAVLLSPWFLLALAACVLWRALVAGKPRRRTWHVMR